MPPAHQDEERLRPPLGGLLLAQLGRAATRRFSAALTPIGISPRQGAALMRLRHDGAMSQQALGEALDTDPSNLVALLNGLEEQGLATRRRDPDDRRRHVVEISKKGLKRLDEIDATAARADEEFFSALEPEERRHLYELLERVAASTDIPGQAALAAAIEREGLHSAG